VATSPRIARLEWVTASELLPHEAHDFTPWLAGNLDMLAEDLGLDDLELLQTEWKVGTFALDILARGSLGDEEVRVVIENQYGATDHKHLGQVLTYSAHEAAAGHRVLAVWIVESAKPEHLATLEFLNRIAAGSNYSLVMLQVRFARGVDPGDHHRVHFEVLAGPNRFLRTATEAGPEPAGTERGRHVLEFAPELESRVSGLGMRRRGAVMTRHGAIAFRCPVTWPIPGQETARVVCSADYTNVGFFFETADAAENWAAAEVLRRRYGQLAGHYGLLGVDWHASSAGIRRDRVLSKLDVGYRNAAAEAIATRAAAIFECWSQLFAEHPVDDLAARTAQVLAEMDAGAGPG